MTLDDEILAQRVRSLVRFIIEGKDTMIAHNAREVVRECMLQLNETEYTAQVKLNQIRELCMLEQGDPETAPLVGMIEAIIESGDGK